MARALGRVTGREGANKECVLSGHLPLGTRCLTLPRNLLGTSAKHYLHLSQLGPKELGYWYPNPVCLWQRTAPADEGVNSPAPRFAKLKCWQKEVGSVHFETINMREWRWDVNNVTQLISFFFCKLLWVELDAISKTTKWSLFALKANHPITRWSKPMSQPVTLKKVKMNGFIKT